MKTIIERTPLTTVNLPVSGPLTQDIRVQWRVKGNPAIALEGRALAIRSVTHQTMSRRETSVAKQARVVYNSSTQVSRPIILSGWTCHLNHHPNPETMGGTNCFVVFLYHSWHLCVVFEKGT